MLNIYSSSTFVHKLHYKLINQFITFSDKLLIILNLWVPEWPILIRFTNGMHINLDTVQLGFFMDAKDPEFFFWGWDGGGCPKIILFSGVELT